MQWLCKIQLYSLFHLSIFSGILFNVCRIFNSLFKYVASSYCFYFQKILCSIIMMDWNILCDKSFDFWLSPHTSALAPPILTNWRAKNDCVAKFLLRCFHHRFECYFIRRFMLIAMVLTTLRVLGYSFSTWSH